MRFPLAVYFRALQPHRFYFWLTSRMQADSFMREKRAARRNVGPSRRATTGRKSISSYETFKYRFVSSVISAWIREIFAAVEIPQWKQDRGGGARRRRSRNTSRTKEKYKNHSKNVRWYPEKYLPFITISINQCSKGIYFRSEKY